MDQPRSLFDLDAALPAVEPPPSDPVAATADDAPPPMPDAAPVARITVRALDLTRGVPASGMPVIFDMIDAAGAPVPLGASSTDADGRAAHPFASSEKGYYRVTFNVAHYFGSTGVESCYPVVSVLVRVSDPSRDFEVPLLFSAAGFSTHHV